MPSDRESAKKTAKSNRKSQLSGAMDEANYFMLGSCSIQVLTKYQKLSQNITNILKICMKVSDAVIEEIICNNLMIKTQIMWRKAFCSSSTNKFYTLGFSF
jgi:TRAP-type mannitol/chloroaromatic compound transport system substrate-binding protein